MRQLEPHHRSKGLLGLVELNLLSPEASIVRSFQVTVGGKATFTVELPFPSPRLWPREVETQGSTLTATLSPRLGWGNRAE